jgi:gliding motility-associated-like protein
MRYIFVILILLFPTFIFCQNQNNFWYFGNKAGISFSNTNPILASPLLDGVLVHAEGVSSICDSNGELLFFTNGIEVWDDTRTQMPNGFALSGDNSSSQIVVVPNPGNCNIYYIFTTNSQGNSEPLRYSVVDMSLRGGLGDVVSKNIFLYQPITERICATLQSNGVDYWIVAQEFDANGFLAFSITGAGVSSIPVTSYSGVDNALGSDIIGCMKISKDGTRLAVACELGHKTCQLFNFNNTTGVVSNPITLYTDGAYGVEFSEDNSKLYLAKYTPFKLFQFNLSTNDPIVIANSITELSNPNPTSFEYGGALQLGPDNKIYGARLGKPYLDVINNPNAAGINCNYTNNGISLNNKSSFAGLPNLINKYNNNFCGRLKAAYVHATLCYNNDIVITASANFGQAPYTYSLNNGAFQNSNIFSNLPTGDYKVVVKDANAITRFVSLSIPNAPVLTLDIDSIKNPNCGQSNGFIKLKTTNGNAPFTYSNNGINFQSSPLFTNLFASTITFTVKDVNNCTAIKNVVLQNINNLKVYAGSDTGIFINETVALKAIDVTNSNFTSYTWSPIEGLDNPNTKNPIATITKNIDYVVTATNQLGCNSKDTIHIDVYKDVEIFVPSAFTPNNDNKNDMLKAIPRGIKKCNFFSIYNRYGQLLFSTNSFFIGWDGKYKNIPQNTDTYIWVTQGIDGKANLINRKGTFTLIR